MTFIHAICVAPGSYASSQPEMVQYLEQPFLDPVFARKYALLAREQSVQFKRSFLPDFSQGATPPPLVFLPDRPVPDIRQRMQVYASLAPVVGHSVAKETLRRAGKSPGDITHLITLSCTGLMAPGLECAIAEQLGLPDGVQRFTVNFMGCYAAFHGLRLADLICASRPDAQVLLVSVELSGLHFQQGHTKDQVLGTYLFNDGAAACMVSGQRPNGVPALQAVRFDSLLLHEGKADMAWNIGLRGFELVLSSRVPDLVLQHIKQAFDHTLSEAGILPASISHYAVHPGGKNILTSFAEALGLPLSALSRSVDILRVFGNMSAATILFVLADLLDDPAAPPGPVYAAAFGPGLTVESALLHLMPAIPDDAPQNQRNHG